jgi:lysozyme family protein
VTEELLFQKAVALVLANEGGLLTAEKAKAIGDPGGETFCGITQSTLDRLKIRWPEHFGRSDLRRPRDMTAHEVMLAYRLEYWPAAKKFARRPPLAVAFMDACVQHGEGKATKLLQSVVGAEQDGAWGPKSQAGLTGASRGVTSLQIALAMVEKRRRFLMLWAKMKRERAAMVDGFEKRMKRVEKACEAVAK